MMIPFSRTRKRRFNVISQALCLFLGALTILVGLRQFTGTFVTGIGVPGVIQNPKPSPVLESFRHESGSPSPIHTHETILLKPSSTVETTAPIKDSSLEDENAELLNMVPAYIKAIMTPDDKSFPRLDCPAPTNNRYDHLRHNSQNTTESAGKVKYFFALDLHECAKLLPRLLGSIVETLRFLGPDNCALSIIEGHSSDGTYEILKALSVDIEKMGVKYFFNRSDIDQNVGERIVALSKLRNLALEPLVSHPDQYSMDATVLFLNDVSICMEDILELIHQRIYQGADMVCPFDWTFPAGLENEPTFYDVWVTRTMTGDSFFNIPEEAANWDHAWDLLWNDDKSRKRYFGRKPFQVYSCWGGAAVFTAKPLLDQKIRFRAFAYGECVQGEPQLFCKDMWYLGYGKIAILPSVNIEYGDEAAQRVKALKGYTSQWVNSDGRESPFEHIEWETNPPAQTRCYQGPWDNQTWVVWDEYLSDGAMDPAAQAVIINTSAGFKKKAN